MASIQPHRGRYRVQVYVGGVRDSAVKDTRKEAAQWALEREAELRGTKLPDKTFAEALRRYAREETEGAGGRWERIRLVALEREPIAKRRIAALGADDFAAWRDARLRQKAKHRETTVKPATVAREMNLMRSVLEVARREWRWIRENPMKDVRWPQCPKGRARRISPEEVEAIARRFGVWDSLAADTARQRTGLAFLFALETAMRAGEILSLTWPNIHLAEQYVTLPKTKNGDSRDVPLTKRAVEILRALPLGFGPAFKLNEGTRDTIWRRVRDASGIADLHFHDARAEAIWRLSKRLDVMELARMIGHRDLKSLMHYYAASASEMARRLG